MLAYLAAVCRKLESGVKTALLTGMALPPLPAATIDAAEPF